jgi:hypothetical protein
VNGKQKLHVLTPVFGCQLAMNYHLSIINLATLASRSGVPFGSSIVSSPLVSLARNDLVDIFLRGDGTHALFIDADIGFDAHDVMRMLQFDREIMGGCYAQKTILWERIQGVCKRSGREYSPEEMAQLGSRIVFNSEDAQGACRLDEPTEVKNIGAGLLMVKREVFERFREFYPDRWFKAWNGGMEVPGKKHDFFRIGVSPGTHEYLPEDFAFCEDCKAMGLKVWMCPWVRTTHTGPYDFVGNLPAIATLCGESAKGAR